MNHLFAAARKAAQDLIATAEDTAFGPAFNPDALRQAMAYREAVEDEIALVEKGFAALASITADVKAMRLNDDNFVLEDEDMYPCMCIDMPVFEVREDSVVIEWPNLIISAEECDRVLAERKAALAPAQ
jgi:hypothetical protein